MTAQVPPSWVSRDAEVAASVQTADATVVAFRRIEVALVPIIGQRGMVALFKRSLQLTSVAHPWMASICDGIEATTDYICLEVAFARQSAAVAATAGAALIKTFTALLATLVGYPLTERLLHAAQAATSGPAGAQEPTA